MHAPLVQSAFTLHCVPAAPLVQTDVGRAPSHTPLQQIPAPSDPQPPTLKLTHSGLRLQMPARQRPSPLHSVSSGLLPQRPPLHSWHTPPQGVRSGTARQRPRTHVVQITQPRQRGGFFLFFFLPAEVSAWLVKPTSARRPAVRRPTKRRRLGVANISRAAAATWSEDKVSPPVIITCLCESDEYPSSPAPLSIVRPPVRPFWPGGPWAPPDPR